ncbi:pentatricopeptide repeat-containing protein At3g29230-like [Ipomoea triloba]|uniref:pentatricopeptide repeat-containing protein At3g29230-like n=1 Tax=Ipomoea triloba TaxID=35885 RepID=UPI00125DBA49|nr:pentatricopeptide repeat-containing protein At3g29230-like [Ipomoea triloba]XP_031119183.1 pentatricopeptide repeat-containing protein At3g29230-like [Ipomoea triloba]
MEQKLLHFLTKCRSSKQLKQTHLQIITNGFKDSNFLVPKFISQSAGLISLDYAVRAFLSVCNPTTFVCNALIKCFIGKTHKDALSTYNQMRASMISPNSFTFTFLLRCHECFDAFEDGTAVHCHIVKLGFESSVFVQNTLLDFYAKCCEDLEMARKLFEVMPERDVVSWNTMIQAYMTYGEMASAFCLFESMPERNVVTWNSVISGIVKAGDIDLAHSVFQRMPQRSDVSWNTMVSAYINSGDLRTAQAIFDDMPAKSVASWTIMVSGHSKLGDLESARRVFDQMPIKNVVSWNAMISGYVHNHMFNEALSVFHHMLIDGKCNPDQSTLISILSASAHLGCHEQGKWIHSYIKRLKFDLAVPLGNALIDMYVKCGDMENAMSVFVNMSRSCVITWTTMIYGMAVNGHCREALNLYDKMCSEGLKPDGVLFIAVLSACVHGGLLEESKRVFEQMVHKFGIKPRIEHYGCMVDLLGRAGCLEEAMSFVETMDLEPNAIIWATLLSACKIHRNGELLESLSKKIMEKEPDNPSYLTLITNLSSSVGRWQDTLNFRTATRHQGKEKLPGCSSIQIGNSVNEFLAKDTRHTQREEIYGVLVILNGHLMSSHDSERKAIMGMAFD